MNNEVENLKALRNTIIISTVILVILIIIIITMKNNVKENLPEEIVEIKPDDVIEIQENEYNKYKYAKISEDRKYIYLLQDYVEQELYDIDSAYESLDAEYKNKRFKDLNDFKEFAENRKNQLKKSYVYEYSKIEYDGYTQYIIKDQYDNYFIFKETAVLEYSILLDSYTIDLPQFTEEYNSADVQGKVNLNIQKFIQAINSKDYNYAYNCLSSGFKDNYFKSVEEFEKYVKENLYNNNNLEFKKFEEESNLYKYTINIINIENSNNIVEKTIIMKLNEGTDFEMSFNVN